jgi:hypothetical protein
MKRVLTGKYFVIMAADTRDVCYDGKRLSILSTGSLLY